MAVEILRVQQAIISFLRTDAQLITMFTGLGKPKVLAFANLAPRELVPPYIVVIAESADDTNTLDGRRAFVNPSFQVAAISKEGGYDQIVPIADRVDSLLTSKEATILDGVYVARLIRSAVIANIDDIDNIRYYSIGQVYENIAYAYTP